MKTILRRSLKAFLRWLLKFLYKVEVKGLEQFEAAGDRVLVVANHTSLLDGLLLAVFVSDEMTFAVNTQIAQNPWFKPFFWFVRILPMDPTNPLSLKSLIEYLRKNQKAVIFPEGRITVTGTLMKIYDGPGMIADKADAMVLPIRIDGAQYTPLSKLRGRVRLRWFPKITLTLLPPTRLQPGNQVHGRDRRQHAGKLLETLMTNMMFATSHHRSTLFQVLLDARHIHGSKHIVAEDIKRRPLSYNQFITACLTLGQSFNNYTTFRENVGVLLPGMCSTATTFFGLQAYGRVPAMLNYTAGSNSMLSARECAQLKTIISSRSFIAAAKLEDCIETLQEKAHIIYLEDIAKNISTLDKLRGWLRTRSARTRYQKRSKKVLPDDPAVILFTSGSEGKPKGVVLSHANLLSNREQLAARIDFNTRDIILNAMPMFHSFGLTAGTLLPLLSGMKVFFYPSPLHYRIVPEVAYDIGATVMFGTNTFLAGYARYAHPYDFYNMRYVFSGAEKLHGETRKIWAEKFGIRVFEGYGTTETSPVLAANTPIHYRAGTVGQLLPGVSHKLLAVEGISQGGRLLVQGPNIMKGYLLSDQPGKLVPPASDAGNGWYDTGDIVDIDDEGFLRIIGRTKRFAKIGGEIVSLSAVEELVAKLWPDSSHAVVTLPDLAKGEQLILLTSHETPDRVALLAHAKATGVNELNVPKKILTLPEIPLLGTGKTDYPAARSLAETAYPA